MKNVSPGPRQSAYKFFRILSYTFFSLGFAWYFASVPSFSFGVPSAQAQVTSSALPASDAFSSLENAVNSVNYQMTASLYSFPPSLAARVADTTAPAVPQLIAPGDGASVPSAGLQLDWSDSVDPRSPVTYVFQASVTPLVGASNALTDPMFTSGTLNYSIINASPQGTYYWQVRSCDSVANCSDWSGPWKVTVNQ